MRTPSRLAGLSLILTGAVFGQARPTYFEAPWMGYETAVYPEGIDPWSSRVADFNGDGVPDLATCAFNGTPWMSILFGDGAGGYEAPETYPIFLESLDLEAVDFDLDGDIDLIVCDTGRFWEGFTLSIFENDGAGNFTETGFVNCNQNGPSSITTADFNGDGWPDLAVAHDRYIEFGNSMSVMLSNGAGGFLNGQVYTLPGGTRAIDSGDLTGDGAPDIVVGNETNRFVVMRNDGDGTFTQGATVPGYTAGSIPELPCIHLADVDLDGDLDVFFSNQDTGGIGSGGLALWRNNGSGSLSGPEFHSFNHYSGGAINITTADITGDGWPDVLAASDAWYLLPGNGSGDLGQPRRFRAGETPISMEAPDLNGDGALDVVVVAKNSLEACVYLNPGQGQFVQPVPLDMTSPDISPAFPTNLEAVDLDDDGHLDLIIGYRSDFENSFGISVRRSNGDGSFGPIEAYPDTIYPVAIEAADVDGDGDDDVIWFDANGRFKIRFNNGDGTLGPLVVSVNKFGTDDFEMRDIDNDGDLDIVIAMGFFIEVVKNNGAGAFSTSVRTELDGYGDAIGLGDFDADGFLDALTNTGVQGYAQISFGLGNGSFGPTFTVSTGRDAHAFDVGDVDSDGNLDFIAVYNLDETGLSVRRGRGDGNFFLNQNYFGSYDKQDHTSGIVLGDATGDGWPDAMTATFGAQDVSFWTNQGDGTYERLQRYGVGEQAYDLEFGDFTGDGVSDLAVAVQVDNGRWWYVGVIILPGTVDAPPADFTLSATDLQRGQPATLTVTDALPQERVYFLYSLAGTGNGPCLPQLGGLCIDLLNPVTLLGDDLADAGGTAQFVATIPPQAPIGLTVHLQAVARRGANGADSVKSNTVNKAVNP